MHTSAAPQPTKTTYGTTPPLPRRLWCARARAPRALVDLLGDVARGLRHDRQRLVDVMLELADGRQRVIARPEDDEQLLPAPGRHETTIANEWGGVRCCTRDAPGSHQRARIRSELHGCVNWTSMPRAALELPDSVEHEARLVERDEPRLHVERVQHPSVASCSMQNLGSEQRIAATVGSGAAHLAETSPRYQTLP